MPDAASSTGRDSLPVPTSSPPGAVGAMTIANAMALSCFRRAEPRVVAGHEHLDRPIRWVHVSEVRGIAALLEGGELLLTTGMGVTSGAARQRTLVRDLADRGVAGVVLEMGHAFDRPPPALVAACQDRGMPLIVLEREARFVEITQAVHEAIIDRQLAILRRGEQLNRRFTELSLQGAGLPDILASLASVIAAPVVLDRVDDGVLYHVSAGLPDADVLAAWEAVRTGDRGVVDTAGDVVVPIASPWQAEWGHLVALALNGPLDDFDRVAVERAVPLISLALLRSREEAALASRQRGNFLVDVLTGRIDPRDAGPRAKSLGFDADRRPMVPLVAVAARRRDRATAAEAELALAWSAATRTLEHHGLPHLIGERPDDGRTLMVIAVPERMTRASAVELVADALHEAVDRHAASLGRLVVAAGAAAPGWSELPDALREAADAARASRDLPAPRWHDATEPDVDRLLRVLAESADVRTFAERRLRPLLEHDRRRSSSLVETLAVLFASGGRKQEAASALHITRQSLYGRLERIERLLGVGLDAPATRFGLELAVRVLRPVD